MDRFDVLNMRFFYIPIDNFSDITVTTDWDNPENHLIDENKEIYVFETQNNALDLNLSIDMLKEIDRNYIDSAFNEKEVTGEDDLLLYDDDDDGTDNHEDDGGIENKFKKRKNDNNNADNSIVNKSKKENLKQTKKVILKLKKKKSK